MRYNFDALAVVRDSICAHRLAQAQEELRLAFPLVRPKLP